ncbi:MAG: hypothetical protein M0P69_14540 [Bacteroidales bacterium]|nr:hypothetical protein [Bacteroidales bacterium]
MANTLNPYEGATALAQAIAQFQRKQRVDPAATALHDMSMQYGQSGTDAEREALNAAANATRQNFLQSGGSPYEIATSLWGADPTQGFQTGESQFTPGYAGDNTTLGQKMKLASMTGMFAGQPTFDRQLQMSQLTGEFGGQPTWQKQVTEAGLTGMYQGQPTWDRELQEKDLALQQALGMMRSQSQGSDSLNMTESKRVAYSSIMNGMLADIDELWKEHPDGPSVEEAEKTIDALEGSFMRDLSKYNLYGVTQKDIQQIVDYVRKQAGLKEKYGSSGSSSTDELTIKGPLNENPQ